MLRVRIASRIVGAHVAIISLSGLPATGRSAGTDLPIIDVELQSDGCFVGRVTKSDGQPAPNAAFSVSNNRGVVVRGCADQQGLVTVHGLQGGVYQFVVGTESHLLRLWSGGTAPPSAIREVLLVQEASVVRAQWAAPRRLNNLARRIKFGARNPLVFGAVLTTAVGAPVIVHNVHQDNKS